MFDDQQNINQPVPPSNLPTEPEDMFAEVDNYSSAPAVNRPPNALDAGLLKPKADTPPAPAPVVVAKPAPIPSAPIPTASPAAPVELAKSAVKPQTAPQPPAMYSMKEPILGKIILFVIFGVLLAGLGYGGWWVYINFIKAAPVAQNIPVIQVPTAEEESNLLENISVTAPETPVDETVSDIPTAIGNEVNQQMKNDEILFGEAIDSDKDGLDDVRETELNTNPNNSDTDADGLNDGDEVLIWKTDPINPDTDGDTYEDGKEIYNGYNPLGAGKLNIVPQATTTLPAS